MDKQKALNILTDMMERLQPDVRDIAYILRDIVRDDLDWKDTNISLQEALGAAIGGRKIQHISWDKQVYVMVIEDRFVKKLGANFTYVQLELNVDEMYGWIVLDR